jgi:protein ImuB
MSGAAQQTRVIVVRCPAWPPPDQASPSAGRRTHPAGTHPARTHPTRAGQQPEEPAGPTARAFEPVVAAVQEFCPRLEVLRPGICAFGARGPARYFGGELELARKIAATVSWLGFDCGIGAADSMFAALLASRDALTLGALPVPVDTLTGEVTSGNEATKATTKPASATPAELAGEAVVIVPPGGTAAFLAPRVVTVLGDTELADLLIRLGIRTLGEFAGLSVADVGNRFGPQGLLAHRLARGLDPRPLAARSPLADVSVQLEFDPPAEQSEQVVFAAKALAAAMHAKLAAKGLACVRLQIQVNCDNGQEISRLWRHDGLLSELAVAERVRWQLDGWLAGRDAGGSQRDDHDEGVQAGGICLLRLVPDQLARSFGRQLGLWGDEVISDRVARAAVRVQAMLGQDAVLYPTLTGGRGAADLVQLVPFGDTRSITRPADRPWPGQLPAPAPATVFPAPRPALVTDAAGTPVTVTGRGEVSADSALRAVPADHRVDRTLASDRTLVGPSAGLQESQVSAGDRGRRRLAGHRQGQRLADRGQLRLS